MEVCRTLCLTAMCHDVDFIPRIPIKLTKTHIWYMRISEVSECSFLFPCNSLHKLLEQIENTLLGNSDSHLFGIFDGHGDAGDACSFFAADKFPICLEKQLSSAGGPKAFEGEGMEKFYAKSFTDINRLLRKTRNIDDSLSGTTGITVITKGDVLYVANVGDSRAIIGSTSQDGKLVASCLSYDQTPFRKDERERLKKKGALIRTMDQLEGREKLHENWGEGEDTGDPPRAWNSSKQVPGCAFTRSIGDAVAEHIGVFAIPEILVWNLGSEDKYVIIASDGIFEFLSNQQVLDLLSDNEDDLIVAAKKIVEKSYNLWLQIDQRTDDITIIIIRISDVYLGEKNDMSAQQPRSLSNYISSIGISSTTRPVRGPLSKQRQKVISECFNFQEEEDFDVEANTTKKSVDELVRIDKMLENNFLFKNLPASDRDVLFKVMKRQECSAGEVIIREGEVGDVMYIIDDGEFMVHKHTERENEDGSRKIENLLLFTYTSEGATFGELSLLYGKPRGATITAKIDGHLWSISKRAFRAVLIKKKKGTLQCLQDISIFSDQRFPNLQRLSQESIAESIEENQTVCSHDANDKSWVIILILSGVVELVSDRPDILGKKRFEGSFIVQDEVGRDFQEVIARKGNVKIAKISRTTFVDVMGQYSESKLSILVPQIRSNTGSTLNMNGTKRSNLLYKNEKSSHFACEKIAFSIGEFGYIGIYKHFERGLSCLKVIAKEKAKIERVETCMLNEREILLEIQGIISFVPSLISSFQDDKFAYLAYEDVFVCDLSTALTLKDMSISNKLFYAACILKAITSLHDFGFIHRFINCSSIYVTLCGYLRVVDFRYCKRMDGTRSYTICGDPLFFAPEIISQVGYDYGADLWAYGCLIYEIFDGESPFTSEDQFEETKLFNTITHHRMEVLKPSERIPLNIFNMIKCLLNPHVNDRLGYKNCDDIMCHPCFDDIKFTSLFDDASKVIAPDECNSDLSGIFKLEDINRYTSEIYNEW